MPTYRIQVDLTTIFDPPIVARSETEATMIFRSLRLEGRTEIRDHIEASPIAIEVPKGTLSRKDAMKMDSHDR